MTDADLIRELESSGDPVKLEAAKRLIELRDAMESVRADVRALKAILPSAREDILALIEEKRRAVQDVRFYRALVERAGHNHENADAWLAECNACQMKARDDGRAKGAV